MKQKTSYSILSCVMICLSLFVISCTPTIATRGNLVPAQKMAKIEPEFSTQYDVTQHWGPPTIIAPFNKNVWYYVGQTTETKGIFKHEVTKQQVLRVEFDEDEVVKSITEVDSSESQDVDFVERTTPTAGKDYTILQQLVGNLGRFNAATAAGGNQ